MSIHNKIGDRVQINGKAGTVQSVEWASFFNGAYIVVKMDDGTTIRSLVL